MHIQPRSPESQTWPDPKSETSVAEAELAAKKPQPDATYAAITVGGRINALRPAPSVR